MPNIFLSNLFIAVYERSKYDIGKSAVYTEVISSLVECTFTAKVNDESSAERRL